jgi:antitoxin component of RelBE/YafQ-DinJ toxin-antitoxin module
MGDRVRVTIRLPASVVAALEAVAAEEGLSVSQVVGLFVRSGLRRAGSLMAEEESR